VIAPPLDAKRPTRDQSTCPNCERSSQTFAPALAARATCRCTPACSTCATRRCAVRVAPRQSAALSRAAKRGESARPEHGSCHTTGAPRERTLPGVRLHLREHKRARCHPRPPAAPSRQTPPNSRRARAPRVLAAWPARAALACDSSSGAPTSGGLASRHEPRTRQPTLGRPSRSRHLHPRLVEPCRYDNRSTRRPEA
jgi:hypothetical protein